jgi:hypothetical protein
MSVITNKQNHVLAIKRQKFNDGSLDNMVNGKRVMNRIMD